MIFLVACAEVPVDSGKAELPLATPFIGITISASPGTLKSTCEIGLTVRDEAGNEVYAGALAGQGREWLGTSIDEGTLYTATAAWTDCSNLDGGTGTMDTASAVSADPGTLLLFHYDGIDAQLDTMIQNEEFIGGQVDVTLTEGADGAALAEAAGVTGSTTSTENVWSMSWTDETPIGSVLMLLSYDDSYQEGTPVWLGDPPNWW